MGSSVASFIYDLFVSGYAAYSPGYLLISLVIRLISGALLAGSSEKLSATLSLIRVC